MKNATVTINYASFRNIKEKADKFDGAKQEREKAFEKRDKFIDEICECIDKANDQNLLEHKQHFIAQGIRAICEYYDMDISVEYEGLDEGQAPEAREKNGAN